MFVCFSNCGVLFSYLWQFRCSEKAWTCLFVCLFVCFSVWGSVNTLHCYRCHEYFPVSEMGHCRYHSMPAKFEPSGRSEGIVMVYPCCQQQVLRFDTTGQVTVSDQAPGFLAPWLPFTESITNDERWVTNDVPWGANDERTVTNDELWVTNDELWGAHDERMVNDEWRMTSYEGRMMNE